jgi:hypothetical protein
MFNKSASPMSRQVLPGSPDFQFRLAEGQNWHLPLSWYRAYWGVWPISGEVVISSFTVGASTA